MQIPCAIRCQDNNWGERRFDRAYLWNGDGVLREHFEEEGFEFLVRTVHFIDEKDRGPWPWVFDCLQQGALDEVVPPKERRLVHARALRFRVSNAEQLAGVVPLVQSLRSIDAFEALESDERCVEH